jgi:hypothetical protein
MAKPSKIDLELLKKLVGELEVSLQTADGIKSATEVNNTDYVVEMSKAAGLAAGVMQEASLLILDIHGLVYSNQGTASKGSTDALLDKILGPFGKGGGNTN